MAAVLLIDDHPDVCEVLSRLLAIYGHRVQVCMDAETAMLSLDRQQPDVIITDDRLPGMSGLELVRSIRRTRQTAELPIILFSADASLADESHRAGATDFWLKGSDWVLDRIAGLDNRLKP
jgi:CheY-like chemotaxis protein